MITMDELTSHNNNLQTSIYDPIILDTQLTQNHNSINNDKCVCTDLKNMISNMGHIVMEGTKYTCV